MRVYADRIRQLRERRGMSQRALADALGVSRSAVGMYETGRREPDIDVCGALADLFAVDMDYLLGRSDRERAPVPPAVPEEERRRVLRSLRLEDYLYEHGYVFLEDLADGSSVCLDRLRDRAAVLPPGGLDQAEAALDRFAAFVMEELMARSEPLAPDDPRRKLLAEAAAEHDPPDPPAS